MIGICNGFQALIKLGFITEHQQLEALSARLGQRYVKIDRIMVQTEAVAMIPVQLAKKYHMLAVQYQDNNLTIVLNDPLDIMELRIFARLLA